MDRRSFRSAYTLRQHLHILDLFREYLVWAEARIDHGQHATTFYYRNIIDCVRYLIHQVAYSSDMVYAPIREYDSSGERLYLRGRLVARLLALFMTRNILSKAAAGHRLALVRILDPINGGRFHIPCGYIRVGNRING